MNSVLGNDFKVIVYTAIFGNIKDELRLPMRQENDDVKFYAFIDREQADKLPSVYNGWTLSYPFFRNENPRLQARIHKLLPHVIFPRCNYSLWLDGTFQLCSDNVDKIISRHLTESDICVFKHKKRICLYDELLACIEQKKDKPDVMTKQVTDYQNEGYPKNNGLAETTAVLRRHTNKIMEFNQKWWEEISMGSYRDQLSFDYVAWKLQMKYATFDGRIGWNPYFKLFDH